MTEQYRQRCPGVQMSGQILVFDRVTKTLDQVRSELLAGFSDTEREAYIHLVDWLRKADVTSRAL